jgi:hypothetical protein
MLFTWGPASSPCVADQFDSARISLASVSPECVGPSVEHERDCGPSSARRSRLRPSGGHRVAADQAPAVVRGRADVVGAAPAGRLTGVPHHEPAVAGAALRQPRQEMRRRQAGRRPSEELAVAPARIRRIRLSGHLEAPMRSRPLHVRHDPQLRSVHRHPVARRPGRVFAPILPRLLPSGFSV